MAKLVECGKFKVIECDVLEMVGIGSYGVCDFCGNPDGKGYLIPVLNSWFCPECYEKWKKTAIWFPQDADYETKKFQLYSKALGISA